MTYPIIRTPEQGHTRKCLASAMICAIENQRDVDCERGEGPVFEAGLDHEFRLSMQKNDALNLADYYLNEGMVSCKCPPVAEVALD